MYILHDYFRSSAAYRVRIALNYKNIPYELREVHLVRNGGEQHSDAYHQLNPQGRVPTLQKGDWSLTQSLSILEYLEETHPEPAILPTDPKQRAQARALMDLISCDVHPLNNLAVLQYLKGPLGISDEQKSVWYAHWIQQGFQAFEALLADLAGTYCVGDAISMADIALIPQVYNANLFQVDLSVFPRIQRIFQHCMQQPAFAQADPDVQPSAPR